MILSTLWTEVPACYLSTVLDISAKSY